MAEKNGRAGGVLGDFSLSQLLATALAAATSFALSTQIGVAGSIIGAVVGAVASAVATQVYRTILASSAEKLRALGSADETRAVGSVSGRAQVEEVAPSGTPIAPPEVRDAAHERAQARLRRRVALLAAAAGVVAVLAYALVVNLATQGGGIGAKPQVAAPIAEEQASQAEPQPKEPAPEAIQPDAPKDTTENEGATAEPETPEQSEPAGDDAASPGDTTSDPTEGEGADGTDQPTEGDAAPSTPTAPETTTN